jgi:putative ABC transport system permease protein
MNLVQDLKHGIRSLRKSLAFTVVAVLVLALGIGANTAIFSVVNALLLRPLPFDDPGRLVQVWHVPPPATFHGMPTFAVSPANYLDWASQNHVFEQLAIYGFESFNLTTGPQPEALTAARVAPQFFSVLRVHPQLGRLFLPEEDQPEHGNVVILSHELWQSHFGANPKIIGQNITLDRKQFTVVGVMPASFHLPAPPMLQWQPKLWTPTAWTDKERAVRNNHNYLVLGRLKAGVNLKQAQAEMNTISQRLQQAYPEDNKGWGAVVIPLREQLVGDARPALMVLLGAVIFVLLIACANVGNLILARTLGRRKEIAIRTALGATHGHLVWQVLSESLLLALAGAAVGLIFARWGIQLIVAFLGNQLPRATEIKLDWQVLAFTLIASLLTGILAGIAPAWRLTRSSPNQALKEGLGRTDAESGGSRTRAAFVISEVALSLVLLIGAGLMIRSLWRLRAVDPGIDPHNVLTMTLDVSPAKYSEPTQRLTYFDQLMLRLRALPGVESAAATDALPFTGGSTQPVATEGRPRLAFSEQPEVAVRTISTGYLSAMRIPLKRGRDFNDNDAADRPDVILISESMAKRFWPNEDPIGKHLIMSFFPEKSREVVGVVGDVKLDGLDVAEPIPTLYAPVSQVPWRFLSLTVRTSSTPTSMVSAVTSAIRQLDPEQPVADVMTMDDMISDSMAQRRLNMLLLMTFASLALLLAAIGIYSVLAYTVRTRVQEIGIRMALGAEQRHVLQMILRQGARLVLVGIVGGTIVALALTHFMASQLYGVTTTDPFTFVGVAMLLVAIALLACYVPARRAMRIDPMVALRYE